MTLRPEPLNASLVKRQIKSRFDISQTLLLLYEFNSQIDEVQLLKSIAAIGDYSYWHDFSYVVGAAFSLWRAAFLTDVDSARPPDRVRKDIHRFMHSLIRDNAINFPQDRDSSGFSVGYYLSNANFRLIAVARRRPGMNAACLSEKILKASTPMDLNTHNADAQDLWEQSFCALQIIVEHITNALNGELASCSE